MTIATQQRMTTRWEYQLDAWVSITDPMSIVSGCLIGALIVGT
jgi:hypothetical protein